MSSTHDRTQLLVLAIIVAVAGALGLAAGSWALLRWGGDAAAVMAAHNGEVLMRRAMVYERAEAYELARDTYEAALAGNFAGPQNRAYSMKGLAVMEKELGNTDRARALLHGLRDSPYWSIAWYKAYVPLLTGDERRAMAERWYRTAESDGHERERLAALEVLAHDYVAAGDLEAAREAFATLVAKRPYSAAAYHLAQLEFERGEVSRTRRLLADYLAGGAVEFSDAAMALLERLESVAEDTGA